jgi:uncharacterized protein YjbI with pentapeptide repeats
VYLEGEPMKEEYKYAPQGEVTDEELGEILAAHQKWLDTDGAGGERADLSNVVDLMGGRLAGANLAGAKMPPQLRRFRELIHVDQTVTIARPIYLIMLLLCLYMVITVFSIGDVSIVKNSPAQLLPEVALGIPISSFILVVSILLFGFYVYLHLYLYRLWQNLGGLPSVFHDGTPLDQAISPWLITAIVRFYQKSGTSTPSLLEISQKWVTIFLVWWMAPITLVSIWARYLVRHDWVGTALHIVLVALAIWSALILFRFARAGLCRDPRPFSGHRGMASSLSLLLIIGVTFAMISVGAFEGTRNAFSLGEPRTWVSGALNLVGMRSCADLSRAPMSESDLSYRDLRCANLFAAKLDLADLNHSDLRGADLTESNLDGADLRYARLETAILRKASLVSADLSNAKLHRTNLNIANLGNADLRTADLRDARLNAARLSGVDLSNATLERVDLSDADLTGANLHRADLSEADLGLAQMKNVNLFGANLRRADLIGTVFTGADLSKVKGLKQDQLDNACGHLVRGLSARVTIKPCPNMSE